MLKELAAAAKAEINYRPPKKPRAKQQSYQAAKRQIKRKQGRGPSCPCTRKLTKHKSTNGNYYTCPKHGFVRYVL